MTTFTDAVYHRGGSPVDGLFTTGQAWYVKPSTGGNGNSGKKLDSAVATVAQAVSLATADKNDVIYLVSEDNSASGTTDYQSATLTISKDGLNIVGVCSGGGIGNRARIAQLSTATGVAPLITWSASNSSMHNVHVFHGVNDATSKGCVNVTGERNYFYRCHFAGIGHATMDTANNYSLQVSGDENVFEECVIGLDTVARGTAANSEILFSGQATRNIFRRCIIPTFAEADTHQFLVAGASSLDRWALFEDCIFINAVKSTATTMTEAFDIHASAGGLILLKNCTVVGATDWEANVESANTFIDGGAPTNNTSGLAVNVEAT